MVMIMVMVNDFLVRVCGNGPVTTSAAAALISFPNVLVISLVLSRQRVHLIQRIVKVH